MSGRIRTDPVEAEEWAMKVVLIVLLVSHLGCLAVGWVMRDWLVF